jgi:hypothetical protein
MGHRVVVKNSHSLTPMPAENYRSKAETCLLAAKSLKSPDARARWLAMAQSWNLIAEQAERNELQFHAVRPDRTETGFHAPDCLRASM